MQPEYKKMDLVLSSGGARGMAHIGVIEALLEQAWTITSIAGSSAGALVGGLYACGKLEQFKEWICSLSKDDVIDLLDFTFTRQGFIKADRVFHEIARIIGPVRIEELPLPFSCVACDVLQNREVVFNKGPLLIALRASIAIPSVVTPVRMPPFLLVDGGVCSPLPIVHLRRTPGAFLGVVDVNANIPYVKPETDYSPAPQSSFSFKRKVFEWLSARNSHEPEREGREFEPGFFDVINKTFDIMQDRITDLTLLHHSPDYLIRISRDAAATFEFYRVMEMMQVGKRSCLETLNK